MKINNIHRLRSGQAFKFIIAVVISGACRHHRFSVYYAVYCQLVHGYCQTSS